MRSTQKVARGAGLIFLGRLGAVVEILSVFLFTRLYGAETFGIFTLFWGYVLILMVVCGTGMTMALQRFVPGETSEARIHRAVRYALLIPVGIGLGIAAVIALLADEIAPFFNAGAGPETVANFIRIYVWTIPIMGLVESLTAAIRARHVFGPEVKIRIFYEQSLRLLGGVGFYYLGYTVYGLFVSHLIALGLVAVLALRLVSRHYSVAMILRSASDGTGMLRDMIQFGGVMVLPELSRKLQGNLPLIFLNALIPGAAGAVAVTAYAVARKIVSALQVIRESFEYVLAPIATAERRKGEAGELQEIFSFATRLMSTVFIPAATLVYLFRLELLRAAGEDFQGAMLATASVVIVILTVGRFLEVLVGPTNSVIAMVGRYRLPLINAVAGAMTTVVLLAFLVPVHGLIGAAISVVIGTNVTSLLAFMELYKLRGLQPYNRTMAVTTLSAFLLSGILYVFVSGAAAFGLGAKLAAGVLGGGLVFFVVVRLAMTADRGRAGKTLSAAADTGPQS